MYAKSVVSASQFWIYNALAFACLSSGRKAGAVEKFQQAEARCRSQLHRKSMRYFTYSSLGIALLGQGRFQEARMAVSESLQICSAKGLVREILFDIQSLRTYSSAAELSEIQQLV